MRWLVTGAGGQLGHHLLVRLRSASEDVVGLMHAQFDVASTSDVDAAIAAHRPDVVINAAAYTAVEAAEQDQDRAHQVNAVGPELLAAALAKRGGRLLQVSTDFVFDGMAERPYEPDDDVAPLSAYGRSKLAGEQAVRATLPSRSHIVRTAWLWGGPGSNFVDTMIRLAAGVSPVPVVTDQVGSPTWAGDLAQALIELGRFDAEPGVVHYVNSGQASRYQQARAVFTLVGADPDRVVPSHSSGGPEQAQRPAWSVLSTQSWTALGLTRPRPWAVALAHQLRPT